MRSTAGATRMRALLVAGSKYQPSTAALDRSMHVSSLPAHYSLLFLPPAQHPCLATQTEPLAVSRLVRSTLPRRHSSQTNVSDTLNHQDVAHSHSLSTHSRRYSRLAFSLFQIHCPMMHYAVPPFSLLASMSTLYRWLLVELVVSR